MIGNNQKNKQRNQKENVGQGFFLNHHSTCVSFFISKHHFCTQLIHTCNYDNAQFHCHSCAISTFLWVFFFCLKRPRHVKLSSSVLTICCLCSFKSSPSSSLLCGWCPSNTNWTRHVASKGQARGIGLIKRKKITNAPYKLQQRFNVNTFKAY